MLRAVVDRDETARGWTTEIERGRVEGLVPDLVYAEVAHVLARYAKTGRLTRGQIGRALHEVLRLSLTVRPLSALAGPALKLSIDRGVSVYDACYLALAQATGATLVTADRGLAAAATDAVLLA